MVRVSCVEDASREFWRSSRRAVAREGMVTLLRRRDITLGGRGRIGGGGVVDIAFFVVD
jgi:hypothetical protein